MVTTTLLVLSNSSLDIYPDNTLTRFTCHLATPILSQDGNKLGVYINGIFVSHNFTLKQNVNHLDYIKVKLKQIELQIQESKFDTCLARIPISTENLKKKHGHYYEFRNSLPVLFQSNKIENLSFLITDSNDNQLQIESGQPTLIKLTVGEMASFKRQFTVSCSSLGDKLTFPNNTISDYIVNLPERLDLNNNWNVAMHSIIIPGSILTVPQDFDQNPTITFIYNNTSQNIVWNVNKLENFHLGEAILKIQAVLDEYSKKGILDNYRVGEDAKAHLNYADRKLKSYRVKLNPKKNGIIFYRKANRYDPFISQVRVIINSSLHFFLTGTLRERIFEFKNRKIVTLENNINLNRLIPRTLLVYTDIVEESIVGHIKAPLLEIVSLTNMQIEKVGPKIYFPENLTFRTLSTQLITKIKFSVRTTSGSLIYPKSNLATEDNNIIINLLFRRT